MIFRPRSSLSSPEGATWICHQRPKLASHLVLLFLSLEEKFYLLVLGTRTPKSNEVRKAQHENNPSKFDHFESEFKGNALKIRPFLGWKLKPMRGICESGRNETRSPVRNSSFAPRFWFRFSKSDAGFVKLRKFCTEPHSLKRTPVYG